MFVYLCRYECVNKNKKFKIRTYSERKILYIFSYPVVYLCFLGAQKNPLDESTFLSTTTYMNSLNESTFLSTTTYVLAEK